MRDETPKPPAFSEIRIIPRQSDTRRIVAAPPHLAMSAAACSLRLPRSVARDVRVSAGGKKARKKSAALKNKVAQQPPVGPADGDVDGSATAGSAVGAPERAEAASAENYGGLGYDGDNAIPYGDTSGASIKISDAMLSVGDVDLLSNASVLVMPGQKVALVGGNGCGKSTLRSASPASARCRTARSPARELAVGYFEQTAVSGSQLTVYQEARSRMDRVNAAAPALREAEARCAAASADEEDACRNADALMDALAEFDMAGGYEAEKRISNVLDGLGFARTQWGREVRRPERRVADARRVGASVAVARRRGRRLAVAR